MRALATLLSYRPRLLERVGLALALVGLLPLAFLAWRLIAITESSLIEQLLRSQAVAARTAAERADAFVGLRRSLAETLSKKLERSSLPTDQLLLAELEALDGVGVLGAALVDPAGAELVRVQLRPAAGAADTVPETAGAVSLVRPPLAMVPVYSADVVDAAGNVARLALDYSITVI